MSGETLRQLPVLWRDVTPGRPRRLMVDFFGDRLLLDATDGPDAYRVAWYAAGADPPAAGVDPGDALLCWYGDVPARAVWPVARRRQTHVGFDAIRLAFSKTPTCDMPDHYRASVRAAVWAE